MEEKRKNDNLPPRGVGFFRQMWLQGRLSWALLRDRRVPLALKSIPLVALVYLISPVDLIPDVIPILGQLDDLGVLMMALTTFNRLAPPYVVEEHMARLREGMVINADDRTRDSSED